MRASPAGPATTCWLPVLPACCARNPAVKGAKGMGLVARLMRCFANRHALPVVGASHGHLMWVVWCVSVPVQPVQLGATCPFVAALLFALVHPTQTAAGGAVVVPHPSDPTCLPACLQATGVLGTGYVLACSTIAPKVWACNTCNVSVCG